MKILSKSVLKRYTLVLDLDETLIHYEEDESETGKVNFRPFLHEFLSSLNEFYDIIIFTASLQEYADPILDYLDQNGSIFKKRYYRQHTTETQTVSLKDLLILNLDLSKVIIVDNTPENFDKQRNNGIFIKSWYNDMSDTALKDLIPFLKSVVVKKVPDVRDYLEKHRNAMISRIQQGCVLFDIGF